MMFTGQGVTKQYAQEMRDTYAALLKLHRCPFCPERFKLWSERFFHLIESHGWMPWAGDLAQRNEQ